MIPRAEIYELPIENRVESTSDHRAPLSTDPSDVIGFVIPFAPPANGTQSVSAEARKKARQKQIAFQSRQMNDLVRMATQFAGSSASVMVTGESGTGKELFSRLIHEKSQRADGPFLALNCAAVPEPLMESEIFGHERGAFTGAIQKRAGYFERANGGTLLLDEITEIPLALQAKLLRVLEEQEVQPVGSDHPRSIDVRIVATSNRELKREVTRGNFRPDLFHRLNVLDLRIPPLRERVSDIPLLAMHFVEMFASESISGISKVTKEAMQCLCSYHWPGNVRELRNVIHRACVVATHGEICPSALPDFASPSAGKEGDQEGLDSLAGLSLADVERKLIISCLQKFGGNKKAAADELGVTARTLSNKLRLYKDKRLPLHN